MLLTAAALLLVTAACTKDEPTDDTRLPEGQYPLEIAAVTLSVEGGEAQPWGAPQTRVSENAYGTGSVFDMNNQFSVQIEGDTQTAIYTVQSDGSVNAENLLFWSDRDDHTVNAWYPATDGTLDLRDQDNGLAYLLHGTGTGDYQTPVELTFTHQLAKVRVTPSDAIGDDEVTSLQLFTYRTCTYNQGKVVQGKNEGWIEMKQCKYSENGNTITCWEANVVPGYTITKLMANRDGKERTLSATINPEVGSFYNITLNKKTYTASTADELMEWAEAVQTDPTLNITLTDNITLTEDWTPIPNYAGTFDGGGNTITGLTINQSATSNVGLFASISEGGTVKNLTLEDVDITAAIYTGAVAGQNDGTIENCSVTGSVTGNALNNDGYVGGIVGENRGTITGCAAEGSVKSSGTYIGGIAGGHREGSITDCHSSATVEGMSWVGGIAGQSDATITACYSTGDVTATKNSWGYSSAGGVVGYSNGAVLTACYATGDVKGDGERVGGVVGDNVYSTVTACYHATGNVTGASGSIGGVAGRNYKDDYGSSTVTACYWDNNQSSGIGEDQTSKGEATKVEGSTTWEIAMNAMNAALTRTGWQYVTGSGDAPLTLQKQ